MLRTEKSLQHCFPPCFDEIIIQSPSENSSHTDLLSGSWTCSHLHFIFHWGKLAAAAAPSLHHQPKGGWLVATFKVIQGFDRNRCQLEAGKMDEWAFLLLWMFMEFGLEQLIISARLPVERLPLFRWFGAVNGLKNSAYLSDSRLKDLRSATHRKIRKKTTSLSSVCLWPFRN